MQRCRLDDDKGIVYSNRVLIGNWYESTKLEEYKLNKFLSQMKKGDLMLARFRKMTENLNKPTALTQSTGAICFGAKVCLLSPHVAAADTPGTDQKGLLLAGRISTNDIAYSQELEAGCSVIMLTNKEPLERSTFVITSADYCDRTNEQLKYNQEFLLAATSSVDKKKPIYIRYDTNSFPGLNGFFPLYLSEHPVANTRWRILPKQRPDLTRFEQEGLPVHVNTDMIINHCSTNINLAVNINHWSMGFYGKVCAPMMKTCLDIYGRELPHNIWQFYIPITG